MNTNIKNMMLNVVLKVSQSIERFVITYESLIEMLIDELLFIIEVLIQLFG